MWYVNGSFIGDRCWSEARKFPFPDRTGFMAPQLETILRELRRRLQDLYGDRLARLILFGSQARGDAEPGSDIDVMVVLRGTVSPGREIARTGGISAEISLKYDVVVSTLFISASRYARERSPLLLNIRREGIAL